MRLHTEHEVVRGLRSLRGRGEDVDTPTRSRRSWRGPCQVRTGGADKPRPTAVEGLERIWRLLRQQLLDEARGLLSRLCIQRTGRLPGEAGVGPPDAPVAADVDARRKRVEILELRQFRAE